MAERKHKGLEFQETVAEVFRQHGFNVEREYAIAGSRVDLLAWRHGEAGELRIAVSCRCSSEQLIGLSRLNTDASFFEFLRSRGDVDAALIVTNADFTLSAKKSASHHRVIPLTIGELDSFLAEPPKIAVIASREPIAQPQAQSPKPTFFVAMPFSKEYQDIFIIGIREVAEKLGVVVLRLDEIEHNSSIPAMIIEKIRTSDALIAETTEPNKNVFYEVGLAHGMGKEVIFLCKEGTMPPFDVAHISHILYDSLVDLRTRLEKRITGNAEPIGAHSASDRAAALVVAHQPDGLCRALLISACGALLGGQCLRRGSRRDLATFKIRRRY